MAHAALRRRRTADDQGHHRLFQAVLADVARRLLFLGAADLADQDHAFGIGVLEEKVEAFGEPDAVDGITADSDRRRLAEAGGRELTDDFAGQRRRPRGDADRAAPGAVRRHDADLADLGRQNALRIRSDESRARADQRLADPHHVEHWHAFGDDDDQRYLGLDRFEHRAAGIRWRHEDDAGIGA